MGLSQKMNQIFGSMQAGAKASGAGLVSIFLKLISGFVIGLTAALAAQELMAFGNFSFLFMFVVVWALVVRALWKMSLVAVIVFDLICVLMALLFRMYLLVAAQ